MLWRMYWVADRFAGICFMRFITPFVRPHYEKDSVI